MTLRWKARILKILVFAATLMAILGLISLGSQAQLFPIPEVERLEVPDPVPVAPAPTRIPEQRGIPNPVGISTGISSLDPFCRQPVAEQERKEQLRQAALGSDPGWAAYTQIVTEHRQQLEQCRRQRWPQIQAVWLRLYPCDGNPGVLDQVFDQIVNLGYNRVLIETFYDGQSILPGLEGSPWPSVQPNQDLLAMALTMARRRGISAYAWVFSMNLGYSYSQLPDRQAALARNGFGRTSLLDPATATLADLDDAVGPDQVFIDPYSAQARQDYLSLLRGILRRQPDGVLFDYIRYPRGTGPSSVAGTVRDLWIHGEAARSGFLDLAANPYTREVFHLFLNQGYVTVNNLRELDARFGPTDPSWRQPGQPQDRAPGLELSLASVGANLDLTAALAASTVQGELRRDPEANGEQDNPDDPAPTPTPVPDPVTRQARLEQLLWPLAVEYAQQGILDYLTTIREPVQHQGIPAGAVFFSDANRRVGAEGYDSRLQPWDRFDPSLEWHPMAYALCEDASCVADQVGQVLAQAGSSTLVCPALAGLWGQSLANRPMLEVQMQTLQQRYPQLSCVSHFAYSWVARQSDQDRKACRV